VGKSNLPGKIGMYKKNTGILILVALTVFITAHFAIGENFKYVPRGKRDPFVPLIGQDKGGALALEDVTSAADLKLEGIAFVGTGRKTAILNSEIVQVNDKIGEVEIKEITKDAVRLLLSGKDYELKLPEEGGLRE